MIKVNSFKYGSAEKVRHISIKDNIITGEVQVSHPEKPVALALYADECPIAFIRVGTGAQLVGPAKQADIWRSFEVFGLRMAYAMAEVQIDLRCGRTGNNLKKIKRKTSLDTQEIPLEVLSVEEFVKKMQQFTPKSIEEILPKVIELFRSKGSRAVVEATYYSFLGRLPEETAYENFTSVSGTEQELHTYLTDVFNSSEAQSRFAPYVPSPSDNNWKF